MTSRNRKLIHLGAKLVVLVALVYIITQNVDVRQVNRAFGNIHWGYLSLSLMCMLLVPLLLAVRLRYISAVAYWPLAGCVLKSNFFNNFFFAQVGGDVYKIVFLSRAVGEKKRAVALVVSDRLIGLTGLLLISAMSVAFGRRYFADDRIYSAVGVYLLLLATAFALIFLLPKSMLQPLHRWGRLGLFADKLSHVRCCAQQIVCKSLLRGLLISIVSYGALIVSNTFAMASVGLDLNILASTVYVPVIAIAVMTIPVSINGLGVRESLYILFFEMSGYSSEEGLALALVMLVNLTLVSVIGGVLILISRGRPAAGGSTSSPAAAPAGEVGKEAR